METFEGLREGSYGKLAMNPSQIEDIAEEAGYEVENQENDFTYNLLTTGPEDVLLKARVEVEDNTEADRFSITFTKFVNGEESETYTRKGRDAKDLYRLLTANAEKLYRNISNMCYKESNMETFEDLRDDIEEYEDEDYFRPEASDVVRYVVYRLTQDEDGEWVEDYDNPDEDAAVYASSDYSETEEYAINYAKEHNCRTHIVICPVDREYEDCSEGRDWWDTYADGCEPYEVIWESDEF